ncbi:3-methyladenine DNA glycosylase [Flagellimonas aquimarina]|uniref:3-methyladenine DNA glycosylase n=1 Tax=Flagellimonas aquimarina TaxID=2201895 RepID=A0A316KX59_9FLAO|nr:DNA alkylation repair protein [Allomuricauda koreensis]PWL38797.1 3-methyladenine DNA glycosylase [Allomuricauda koreensis]
MAFKQLKLWFDGDLANLLANKLMEQQVEFDKSSFVRTIADEVDDLELKDRVECIADTLKSHLSKDYPVAISQLIKILGPENEKETGMFKEYYWVMPIAKYVEKYGLEHFDISMNAIQEITKRNTGEYTIRPYLERYSERTLKVMKTWSKDKNKHVRRLSSEGVRPRLPWASKLDIFIKDPSPILPILESLKDDASKYVQTSVANCINDILKDNPEIAKKLIARWARNATKERKWIIKHALRNLIKTKDLWALKMVE